MTRVLPALALIAVVLVAGCASKPSGRRESPAGAATSGPTSAPAAASNAPKKGGGYYLDDGPGANPPADLDLVPDAVPKIEKYASGANRPYNVFGVDYVPDLSGAPYKQRGVGSWYGRKFHGQRTSSGEIYDMYGMTAAHPTLPIPCYALVTNLQNGKSVIVRVNDRGPFLHNRVMDLSYAAALKLGYLSSGSGTIEVEMLSPSDIAAGRIPVTTNSLYIASAAAAGRRLDPGATTNGANSPSQGIPGASIATTVAIPLETPPEATPIASTASTTTLSSKTPSAAIGGSFDATVPLRVPAEPSSSESHADRGIPADLVPIADPQPGPTLPAIASSTGFYLQLGAFRARAGADSFASHVAREIDPAIASRVHVAGYNGLYRVRIGPYTQRGDADAAASSLRAAIAQPVLVMPSESGFR
jgi:rare lipoprotein A